MSQEVDDLTNDRIGFENILNEDKLIQIGKYIFKIDIEKGYAAYIENEKYINFLINDQFDSDNVKLFSTHDDVLHLLENGVYETISNLNELDDYNNSLPKDDGFLNLENSSRLLNVNQSPTSYEFPQNAPSSSAINFVFDNPQSFAFFDQGSCSYSPIWGFPYPRSNNTINQWRFMDIYATGPNITNDRYYAYLDLTYIRAAVYFELKTELYYKINENSSNNTNLVISNNFIYERRRRFQSNLIVEDVITTSPSLNSSYLRSFIYTGSRSLRGFSVQSTFSYDNIVTNTNLCSLSSNMGRRTVTTLTVSESY